MQNEKEELRSASESLREDYQSDKELTTFTQLDNEPFKEAEPAADVIVSPDLTGKYDEEPLFQEKVNRANHILKTFGLPKF